MAAAPATATASNAVEIIFADAVVRVHEGVDAALLRTIFQSLRA
jgi:transposase